MSMFGFIEWVEAGSYGIAIDRDFLYAESFLSTRGRIYKYTKDGTNFYRVNKHQLIELYYDFLKPTMISFPCPQRIKFFENLNEILYL